MPLPQLQAEAPRLAEYQAYIDFEMKIGDPARIQLIFGAPWLRTACSRLMDPLQSVPSKITYLF